MRKAKWSCRLGQRRRPHKPKSPAIRRPQPAGAVAPVGLSVAAAVPDAPEDLRGLALADSVAVDPHKWLYAPLEAGCVLVRDAERLRAAFAYHPPYYHFDEQATNYLDFGPQNSRGFRALKVWLALRQAGAAGYRTMIADDMRLSRLMADAVARHPDLELTSQALSITTFRYVPAVFNDRWAHDARIFYAFEALGAGPKVHRPLFDAIHKEKLDTAKQEAFNAFLGKAGIDAKKFDEAFRSFGVQSKMRRAAQMTQAYRVDGTPSLAVHGVYTVSADQGGTAQGMFAIAQSTAASKWSSEVTARQGADWAQVKNARNPKTNAASPLFACTPQTPATGQSQLQFKCRFEAIPCLAPPVAASTPAPAARPRWAATRWSKWRTRC